MTQTQFLIPTLFLMAPTIFAQDGTAAPPPTYDYDSATAGVQGPKSPLVTGFTYRSFRAYQLAVPVVVSLADLQAILPPGYSAIANPAGSANTSITLNFFLDQRFQPDVSQATTYGPTSAMLVTATVLNSNLSTPRQEIVFPSFEAAAGVDQLNAAFGPGTASLAKVKAEVVEHKGKLKFVFLITDAATGFDIAVGALGPDTLNTRSLSDPVGLPFRALNGLSANPAFWASSQSDTLAVPISDASLNLSTSDNMLHFPAGALNILGLGANMTFSRGVEFIIKFE